MASVTDLSNFQLVQIAVGVIITGYALRFLQELYRVRTSLEGLVCSYYTYEEGFGHC